MPTLDNDVFYNSSISGATLNVPESSVNAYKAADQWKAFGTITAIPKSYFKLIYKVDGAIYKEYSIEYDASITPEPEPAKEGYTFSGWSDIPTTMPDHDVEVTGTFAINKYTIKFINEDGTVLQSNEVEYGQTPQYNGETPTKASTAEYSYTFNGWTPDIVVAKDDATYTAIYTSTANSYKLTYKIDGTEYKSVTLPYGSTITLEPSPTKEGYTFSGWSEIPQTMPAHDVEITGTFNINQYMVKFVADDKTISEQKLDYGTAITAPDDPTKEGYTFTGWNPTVDATVPAHDVTYIAQFSINSYNLTYKVDGELYKEYTLEYGASIISEPAPTKEGYTFSGWSEIPTTMPAHDVEVTSSFAINQYTIKFIADNKTISEQKLDYGTTITVPSDPTKEGYTFIGWNPTVDATVPAHDVTYIAQFSINSYDLTYKVDGELYKEYTLEYGASITPEPAPTKVGATFSGWSSIPSTMPAHNVEITGSFSSDSYTLTYKVDGNIYKTSILAYGAAITPEPAPTKEGYTFSGWSPIPSTMPDHDVEVTGTFTINQYTITFNTDGGSTINPITQDYGTVITIPADPTKTGYTFTGWDKEIPGTMPAENMTITAKWAINYYRLTYKVDNSTYWETTVEYNTVITPEPNPTKEGYTFSGWSPIPSTMPAHDVEVNGSFTINQYDVKFVADSVTIKEEMLDFGSTIVAPTDPMKEGYEFKGWNPELDKTVPSHDVTYTAIFEAVDGIISTTYDNDVSVEIRTISGQLIKKEANKRDIQILPTGIYIINGKKISKK